MPSNLQLQDLYNEPLVRELIEKTKNCALDWTHEGGTTFKTVQTKIDLIDDMAITVTWAFFITKTQITNLTYQYSLDAKKNDLPVLCVESGALPNTNRESQVKELYDIGELITLDLDKKLKEVINFVQAIEGCRET